MRRVLVPLLLGLTLASTLVGQEAPVAEAGWSGTGLSRVFDFTDSIGSAALLIISDGRVVASRGRVDHPFRAHSIRKSLLSALVGMAISEGVIDTTSSLADLGVDDSGGLSATERQARVLDLLAARSGVYHEAASETEDMRATRPARDGHRPGEHWYYNNWDFNALGSIYTQLTGRTVGDGFESQLAEPLGMQDFRLGEHFRYQLEPEHSEHPAYKFRLSARDLAKFGTLFAHGGRLDGVQLVPAEWVSTSTSLRSPTDQSGTKSGYGLMWWVTGPNSLGLPEGSFTASGSGGQRLTVIPATRTVVVHLMDTDVSGGPRIGTRVYNRLLQLVLQAQVR